MWQTLLKDKQPDILLPPGFLKADVLGKNRCMYTISLKKPLKTWAFVSLLGKKGHDATEQEIYSDLVRYPTIRCCFLQVDSTEPNCWIVCTDNHVVKMRFIPDIAVAPTPLTTIIGKGLGGVVAFHSFDYRDMQPWNIDRALESLHLKDLKASMDFPWLKNEQKLALGILIEAELKNRVPVPEQQIKSLMDREKANLISMNKTKTGYSLSFRYRGKIRKVQINENLTLRDSGMCLSGHDRDYSLDSFIAVLQYEDRRDEFPANYARNNDDYDDDDYDDY